MSITKIKYNMAKYINKDALIAEIERLIEIANNNYAKFLGNRSAWAHQRDVCEKLLSFLDTLEVKEVGVDLGDPSGDIGVKTVWDSSNSLEISRHGNSHIEDDLEEAATKYAQDKYLPVQTAQSFKAGANWQKEQIMKDAIEREVKEDAGGYPYIDATELYDYDNDNPLAKAGDKVKVIIMTKE